MSNIVIYRHQLFKASEGFIYDQTRHLVEHKVIFAGRKVEGPLPNSNLHIKTLPPGSRRQQARHAVFRNQRYLYETLVSEKPRLIHAHFGVEGVYALSLAKRLHIPLITTFHGFDATCSRKGLLLSRKISWLHYLASRQALANQGRLFITVSHFIREKLLALGFPSDRVITHYIGVDIDNIKPTSQIKQFKYILHVARLVDVKGTRYLLEAFARIKHHHPDVMLVIIGDGPLKSSLEIYAKTLGLAGRVQFLGALPHAQVIEHMQHASVFCVPSQTTAFGNAEGLGLVFLEAAACQLPVVATRHGGIPEAVREGETGFLVRERDARALAERLSYLLTNDSLCFRMGKAGRELVERHFNLREQTRKLEGIYRDLI